MKRLPRTWPVFFAKHGNFTATQFAAIPPILDGANVLICSPTAGGKTEAALAPLIERHCHSRDEGLGLLYITPTRALGGDLLQRLTFPLEQLHLSCAIKTRDLNTFSVERPASLLITTPESVDSLLTSSARVLSSLRGIIVDEIHLFDGTPRGDQLRILLNRIREIRTYAAQQGDAPDANIQFVALSATVSNGAEVASRYITDAQVVTVAGGRTIQAEILPLISDDDQELRDFLQTFSQRGWRKALAFCNSRAEVEHYAAAARVSSPFGNSIYVHYSNIAPDRRRMVEERFDQDEAAICFASSTLELGIDIGSIDTILLIGPPGDGRSFIQRLGRGNRRKEIIQAACFYRTTVEEVIFRVLLALAERGMIEETAARFRSSVAVQQIFSTLKQSPNAAVRLNTLQSLLGELIAPDNLAAIIGHLEFLEYLKPGRPGEWRAGAQLNRLVDEQTKPDAPLSLYSNIQTEQSQIDVRDRDTHKTIARVSTHLRENPSLTLEGRSLRVTWSDGDALWVVSEAESKSARRPAFRSSRQFLSFQVAQHLPSILGLQAGMTPLIEMPTGRWLWFHWLGDLYGHILFDLIRPYVAVEKSQYPGLCLYFSLEPKALPAWSEHQIARYLAEDYRRIETWLDLGAFYRHLPPDERQRAIVEQIGPERFAAIVADLHLTKCPPDFVEDLYRLVGTE